MRVSAATLPRPTSSRASLRIKTLTTEQCADLFYDEICCNQERGIPKELVSDRDSRFTDEFWKQTQQRCGTALRFSTARQQSTNGKAKRAVSVIEEVMSMFVNYKQDNWSQLLPQILFSINNTPDSQHDYARSPLFIEYGYNPRTPIDLLDALPDEAAKFETADERIVRITALREEIREAVQERQRKMKEKADNRRRRSVKPFSFQPGTKVWLNVSGLDLSEFHLRLAAKLHPRFCGPFK
eukprot:SAG11_NODE_944_length_6433_cov_3.988949_3_plen_240_part_00